MRLLYLTVLILFLQGYLIEQNSSLQAGHIGVTLATECFIDFERCNILNDTSSSTSQLMASKANDTEKCSIKCSNFVAGVNFKSKCIGEVSRSVWLFKMMFFYCKS